LLTADGSFECTANCGQVFPDLPSLKEHFQRGDHGLAQKFEEEENEVERIKMKTFKPVRLKKRVVLLSNEPRAYYQDPNVVPK